MKVYLQENVYEAALKRFEWIFDEFKNVVVAFSGGKDSTVCLELALEVARKKNRLPLKVLFIDQEAEWQHTVDYVREVMYRPEVDPVWIQCPIRLFNAASFDEDWLYCWDEKDKDHWMHPQDPKAITKNVFGTDRFKPMFAAVERWLFNNEPFASIGGVRTQENITRYTGLTASLSYKDITWGHIDGKGGYTFYPIYDWGYDDVWTYIAKNKVNYNRIYDLMFNYGVPTHKMRVSNLHHETAVASLMLLQEVERETYNKLCARLPGISTFSQMQANAITITELPDMFTSWKEYRDYLLENLIRPDLRDNFRKLWKGQDGDEWYVHHCNEIMIDDWTGTTNNNSKSAMNMMKKKADGVFERRYQELIERNMDDDDEDIP